MTDSHLNDAERSLLPGSRSASVLPASDLLTVIGSDGCFKHLAPDFAPAFGYVEADLLDRRFLSFIHPAHTASTRAALEKLAQGQPALMLENRFRCKDASYRRLAWMAIPTPEGLVYAVARDITERGSPDDKSAAISPNEDRPTIRAPGRSRVIKQLH